MNESSQPSPNPFESPRADLAEEGELLPPGHRGDMPTSVIVAISATTIAVLMWGVGAVINLTSGQNATFSVIGFLVGLLIIYGLAKGHRLAYQWGRILVLISAVLYTIGGIFGAIGVVALLNNPELLTAEGMPPNAIVTPSALILGFAMLAATVIAMWTIFFSLGRPSARQYFRLICPRCGHKKVRAADFLFNKAKCKKCSAMW